MQTKIISVRNPSAVSKVVHVLKNGGIIIYPTETSYGIGVDATNKNAISKIFRIKQRPKEKKFLVLFGDTTIAKKYVVFDKTSKILSKKFMPGPLTLINKSRNGGTLAWRISSNSFARRISKKFKKPITSTSANISGSPPLYRIEDVIKTFSGKVDLIINSGNLRKRKSSTIFDLTRMKLIRKGRISKKRILRALDR